MAPTLVKAESVARLVAEVRAFAVVRADRLVSVPFVEAVILVALPVKAPVNVVVERLFVDGLNVIPVPKLKG
jgi:hypothetical protein